MQLLIHSSLCNPLTMSFEVTPTVWTTKNKKNMGQWENIPMLMLFTGVKGEPCYECLGSGPPGPPGPRGPPGIPGKTSHCMQRHSFYPLCPTSILYVLYVLYIYILYVSATQATIKDQVIKVIRAFQDVKAYLEDQ